MSLTMIPQKYAMTSIVILAAFAALSPWAICQAETSPTACVGANLEDLQAASKADSKNIGLHMRIVRKILQQLPTTDNRRRSKLMLEELENQLDGIKKLDPEFTYIYRVLARQHERKKEFLKVLEVLDDYAKVTALDYDMRNMRVRAMLRLASRKEDPLPEKTAEAAEYVAQWFSSGTAPVFAETLASSGTWMIDKMFRRSLLQRYAKMYKESPKDINLIISYASSLYVAGRNESAWSVMRKAENIGLCDDVMGGRHPLIELLELRCPEDAETEIYSGLDIDQLRKQSADHKENLSLTYRLAVRLKAKAYTGERIIAKIADAIIEDEEELADAERRGEAKDIDKLRGKLKRLNEQKADIEKQVKEAYAEALPFALQVRNANKNIDSVTLLLADITSKLGDTQQSIKFLKESIERVPFFIPLRDKLAGIHSESEDWVHAAEALVGVCRLVSCRAGTWEDGESDAELPKPVVGREQLIARMAQDPKAQSALISAFEAAVAKDPRNPNLESFLSMSYFFAGDKEKAAKAMLRAEFLGVCGEDGFAHPLAVFIYSRTNWK